MSMASSPVRNPDLNSPEQMTTRAWWLVALNFLIPGSPQLIAGNRRMGRFGVGATFVLWGILVVLLVLFFVWRVAVLTLVSTSIGLWLIAIGLLFYGVLWIVLTLDTLRLVRLVKTAPDARGWIAGVTTVLMVLVGGGAAYGAYIATTTSSFVSDVFVAAPPEPPIDGRYNIMLLGGDAGPDRDGLRPDSISLVSIDATTGQATMIGLPRNLEDAPFAEGSPMQAKYPQGYGAVDGCEVDVCLLNSVYTEVELYSPEMYPNAVAEGSQPGIEAMRDAVEGITGLQVQYYVLVEMQAFLDLVDALGGVTVTVESPVNLYTDDTFETVSETIGPGVVTLDGYHALEYARARHDTTDYERMARQRQLEIAILEQFNPANVLTKFQAVATAGARLVKTDIPQSTLGAFVDLASKTKDLPITELGLDPSNDVDPEFPDYPYIRQLVADATVTASQEDATTE